MRRARQISLIVGISSLTFVLGAALAEYRHRGFHRNRPTGQAPPCDEGKRDAEKVSTLLSRDSVKKRLNDLANSEVPWVQITAKRALDPDGI
jgi:hypothetical protein